MRRREKDRSKKALDFGASHIGAAASAREAAASDAMREGMDRFRSITNQYRNLGKHLRKGYTFEAIEAAKVNTDAAQKGIGNRLKLSKSGDAADAIEYSKHGKKVGEFQYKAHERANDAQKALADPKYRNMARVTVKDHAGKIPGARGQTEIAGGKASSGGTTHRELTFADNHPKAYANLLEFKNVVNESAVAAKSAATAGAIMGGVQSTIKNYLAVHRGEIDGKQARVNIVRDSAKSGIRSGSGGALGAFIRHIGRKLKFSSLTKSNVATAVASGVIDGGVTVYGFAKGEISAEEAATRLGDTGCSTLSGIYVGAAGGVVFGPAGVLVGSVVGYMLAASVYQSCLAILKDAKLAEEEAERIVALCKEAAKAMDDRRRQFETKLTTYLKVRQASFDKHFKQIDDAFFADDHQKAIKGLSGLARSFAKELKLARFEDFREFMVTSDEPLKL